MQQQVSSQTPGFYMQADGDIFNRMLYSGYDYIPDLRAAELSPEDDGGKEGEDTPQPGVITQSLVNGKALASGMLVRVLQPALQSDGTAQEVLQLFDANVNSEYSAQVWKELGAEWKEGDSKGNAANLYRMLREEPGAMSGKIAEVMNNYLNRAWSSDDKTQGGVPAFVSSLITDNVIFRDNRLRQPDAGFLPAIRDALSQYGDRSRIATFFDSWGQVPDWLTMNSTPEQLFGIQYNANADAVTAGFIDQSSDDMLATVIAGVPSMTTGQYTRLAAAKLGIDPMVLSPQLTAAKDTIKLAEHHIYGSSRLGIQNYDTSTLMNTYDQSAGTNTGFAMSTPAVWYSYLYGDVISRSYKEPWGHGDNGRWSVNRTLGKRYYELTDHLGNVLATVMDRKTGHMNSSIPTLYDYYNSDVVSATDYYPGGMPMNGRSVNANQFRYGAQNQQKDDEIYGAGNEYAFKYRMEDARLNRFWSVDPLAKKYPYNSSYAFSENRLTDGVELEGLEHIYYNLTTDAKTGNVVLQHTKSEYLRYDPIVKRWEAYPLGIYVNYKGDQYSFYKGGHAPYLPQNTTDAFETWVNTPAKNRGSFSATFGSDMQWKYGLGNAILDDYENALMWIAASRGHIEEENMSSGTRRSMSGSAYEDFLNRTFGGRDSFKAGGREFDGSYGANNNHWYEAKSGDYFTNNFNFERFKSDMGDRLKIAKDNGATYEIISEKQIPDNVKQFLDKKGIKYMENVSRTPMGDKNDF